MQGDAGLSPLRAQRRERILDAAQATFLRDGLRGATMEGIAVAAGLSKVTLYGYVRDKEAAFAAVAQRLAGRLRAAFDAALAGTGDPPSRIAAALSAKHGAIAALLTGSPHPRELLAARTHVADIFRDLDRDMTWAIAALTGDTQAARIVFDGAAGLAEAASGSPTLGPDIARLVRAVLVVGPEGLEPPTKAL
jgi:AcrR family transcriptional regulator